MVTLVVAVSSLAAFLVLLFVIIWWAGPSREVLTVDAVPGEWTALAFVPGERKTFRLCVRAQVTGGDEDAGVQAELEARVADRVLHPCGPARIGRNRWFIHNDRFTVVVWTVPAVEPGTRVDLRVRTVAEPGTVVREARVFLAR